MRLLALLHAFGLNTAIVAGLVLMPAVVAVGYLTDHEQGLGTGHGFHAELRGSFDGGTALAATSALDAQLRHDRL